MEQRPKKKQRKNPRANDVAVINNMPTINDVPVINTSATTSSTSLTSANMYDPSLIFDQDYEYQLSMIADMEKQDRIEKECMEQIAKMEALVSAAELDTRNFHIKQILRKIKIGPGTNLQDKIYISILESWMDSNLLFLKSESAGSFHSFLETKIRVSKETVEYMKKHICINK